MDKEHVVASASGVSEAGLSAVKRTSSNFNSLVRVAFEHHLIIRVNVAFTMLAYNSLQHQRPHKQHVDDKIFLGDSLGFFVKFTPSR